MNEEAERSGLRELKALSEERAAVAKAVEQKASIAWEKAWEAEAESKRTAREAKAAEDRARELREEARAAEAAAAEVRWAAAIGRE